MRICIVAASLEEIQPFVDKYKLEESHSKRIKGDDIEYLITGIGLTAMTYYLVHHILFRRADLYILAGLGGAFNENLKIGSVVEVESDLFADLGAQDKKGEFLTLKDMGLNSEPVIRWPSTNVYNLELMKTSGITVHQIMKVQKRIDYVTEKFNPDVCTMEGAAFHYVMKKKEIKAIHIRSISHYVGNRDIEEWNLPLAIRNLNLFLNNFIEGILLSSEDGFIT